MSAAAAAAVSPPRGANRLLAGIGDGGPASLDEHVARFGALEPRPDLIATIEASGLRGRGGAAFPAGTKLRSVASSGRRAVVVVNGAEGEPASAKDRTLLAYAPHLVLDGAAAAATAVGAREVVVAIRAGARAARAAAADAIAQRSDPVRWRLASVPGGFVAGEETALLRAVAGAEAQPTLKPPYPFERGLGGAPTLVQNVETLAHVALAARFGAAWFRSLGTAAEPGTALVTLSGAVARPGVYELELGTRLTELVDLAGGATEPLDAFLVGGYSGVWTRDRTLRLSAANGLGAGVVVALPARVCGVRESARVARYLAAESAGQCGPCTHGLAALAGGLDQIAAGRRGDPRLLERWARQVTGRGACRHPDGAARFVRSALQTFEREIALHLRKGRCSGDDRRVLPTGRER